MEILLLVLTIGLPLLKFILFPARTIGRGGNWTLIGAAMLVGLIMVLWFGIQSFSNVATDPGTAALVGKALAQQNLPDLEHLSKLY